MGEHTDELFDELVRLQALSLRRSLDTQAEAILALAQAGFENSRIAALLGTIPATVRTTRNKAKATDE